MCFSSILWLRDRRICRVLSLAAACAACVWSLPASAQLPSALTQSRALGIPAVDFNSQAVILSVPIVGTPFQFNYRSNAVGPKWRLSVYHLYDAATETLSPGGGRPRYATALFPQSRTPSSWISAGEMAVAASDGGELYIFNNKGQHLRTLNALTGAALFRFDYNSTGVLRD